MKVELDFETSSDVDLSEAGAYVYASHPSTNVICLSYAFDDGEPATWQPGEVMPYPLRLAVTLGSATFEAHNSTFERMIWRFIMERIYDWPPIAFDRWRCTMAAALYRGMPAKLVVVAKVLPLRNQKDMTGHAAMLRVSRGKAKPGDLEATLKYCPQDVRVEQELSRVVGPLSAGELAIWRLDQRINDRGITVDVDAARAGLAIVTEIGGAMESELAILTGGEVERPSQIARMKRWLAERGVSLADMKKETVDNAVRDTPPGVERRVLEIKQAMQANTAKLEAMLQCTCPDGRARGLLQYHGAGTGRWAGRLIQPQNFIRPAKEYEHVVPEALVEDVRLGDAAYLDMLYGNANDAVAHAQRPMLMAERGKTLTAGDFSAIEAVVTAALAGEERKLDVFRRKEDPYLVFGGLVAGYTINKKEHPAERTIGKMGELSFGYGGGVGAWRNFEPKGKVSKFTDDDINKYKMLWRSQHPHIAGDREEGITGIWQGLEDACIATVQTGRPHSYRDAAEYFMATDGPWLGCRLSSGAIMWYRSPRVVEAAMPWNDRAGNPVFRPQMEYKAWKPAYGGWVTVRAWGGHLTENVVQKASRELLVEAMFRVEAEGEKIVLTVHDEILTEGNTPATTLQQVMEARPAWASTWPIRVSAWQAERYRKE